MKILKNRIFLSALCIIAAAVVSFVLLPGFYENKDATVMVLRAAEDIPAGTRIEDKHLAKVEIGKPGLPEGVINDRTQIVGKIAQTDISKGDYFFPKKLGEYLANEKLDRIAAENKRLVTVSVLSIAAGLSSHLQSGDIVTVAVFLNKTSDNQSATPQVILYPELKGLEVYSVENSRTQSTAEVRKQQAGGQPSSGDPIPKAVTLVVTEAQAEKLIEAEYTGKLHLIFEKRGVSREQ
ncbi:Flp pilus assembly protein CpaB [Thermanaerosceptrum fracticalcis]|uniref:Flp pilus assembly protein CpaB n=1 Tax=Thermanaerosceptrum fracticalcis TaxID=1712410 RepID=A0A7G6E585_THEFR|nr:Flp pilus assembly protein CpaB [Thermanaerosceptrum fracticalcis]QNB47239.1 Flp pilus assembly protein CpaB [Thermanaerosceptrum fracticalcis]